MKIKQVAFINPKPFFKIIGKINYIDTSSVEDGHLNRIQVLKDNYPSRAQRTIQLNDILISSVRPNLLHNYFVKNTIDYGVCSTGFIQIRVINSKINPRYIYYLLTSKNKIKLYCSVAESSQTTFPSFNKDIIEEIKIPNISYDDQCHIVDTIGSIDDLIESNNEIINKFNDLLWARYLKFKEYIKDNKTNTLKTKILLQSLQEKRMLMLHP